MEIFLEDDVKCRAFKKVDTGVYAAKDEWLDHWSSLDDGSFSSNWEPKTKRLPRSYSRQFFI